MTGQRYTSTPFFIFIVYNYLAIPEGGGSQKAEPARLPANIEYNYLVTNDKEWISLKKSYRIK